MSFASLSTKIRRILPCEKGASSAIIGPAASTMGRLTRQNLRGEKRMRRRLTILLFGMIALSNPASVNRLLGQEKKDALPEPAVKVGDMAPDFTLLDTKRNQVSLHDFRGKKNVALAFYIFAFTGG
jgi:hypothetical protein